MASRARLILALVTEEPSLDQLIARRAEIRDRLDARMAGVAESAPIEVRHFYYGDLKERFGLSEAPNTIWRWL